MITSSIGPAPAARRAEHPLDDLRRGVEQIAACRVEVCPADGHRRPARRGAHQHLPGCPGAQVLLRRLGVQDEFAQHALVVGDLVDLIGRELRREPFQDQVEETLVDIGAAE